MNEIHNGHGNAGIPGATNAKEGLTTIKRNLLNSIVAGAALYALARPAHAAAAAHPWPARVFAPYMYLGQNDDFKLTESDEACGLKHYTLAFIIARQDGHGPGAKVYPEPAWDGRVAM